MLQLFRAKAAYYAAHMRGWYLDLIMYVLQNGGEEYPRLLKPFVFFAAWLVKFDVRKILDEGRVRDIKYVGEFLAKADDPETAKLGKFVANNAEGYVLYRVFKRWIGGR